MFTYIFYILLVFIDFCQARIEIKDAGIGYIEEGDIALIFYLTLENVCEKDLEISVNMVQCCETLNSNENDCDYMNLIGGDMGMLYSKYTKNVTLIYPNLYLYSRHGTCTIAVNYQNENGLKTVTKEIEFRTNDTAYEKNQNQCSSMDLDPLQGCSPVDCVVKYSGEKNYFNPNYMECQYVPSCVTDPHKCLPEIAYSIGNNNCSNLNCSITKFDLELLENNQVDVYDVDTVVPGRIVCHHGEVDSTGQCRCDIEWVTTMDEQELYEPSLMQYHMCNVERGSWNCVNRDKIKATGVIIAIFALTIASKIIILMCVLSICYKHFKSSKKDKTCIDHLESFDESLILCENQMDVDQCICDELPKRSLKSETVNVSFFVAKPSMLSTKRSKEDERKSSGSLKKSTSDKVSTRTTSSSVPISFQTDSDYTTEDSSASAEEDYDIEFTGEEEECYCQPEEEEQESYGGPCGQSKQSICRPSLAKVSEKSRSQHSKSSKQKSRVTLPDEGG